MSEKICLFAGTTEGRQLAGILHHCTDLTVCVATEYGEILLDGIDGINVHTGRMDADEMLCFFKEKRVNCRSFTFRYISFFWHIPAFFRPLLIKGLKHSHR